MESIVIVGGGQAGGWAAKTLRDQNYQGKITLLGDEMYPPYERPPLSKDVLLDKRSPETAYLFSANQLEHLRIEHHAGCRATAIDRQAKKVVLFDGKTVGYDRLMLATGSRVRSLQVEGANLSGVYYLRGINDAVAIRRSLVPGSRLLIIGGGWIGLEVAAAARQKGVDVVLVEAAGQVCSRVLPPDIAGYVQHYHQNKGVRFVLNTTVTKINGENGIESVELSNGERIFADSSVIGIGVMPNDEIAREAGLNVDNGIIVDATGRSSDRDIFSAGDVANQLDGAGKRVRIESWSNAQNQAIAVAKAMLGLQSLYRDLPYFWSDQYDLKIQILGSSTNFDEVSVRGEESSCQFIKCFLKGGLISMAIGINSSQELPIVRRLMQRSVKIEREQFSGVKNLSEILRAAQA